MRLMKYRVPMNSQEQSFTIKSYGDGEPRSMLIGGLAYSPSDYEQFAQQLNGTAIIIDNPNHKNQHRPENWQQKLREGYARIFNEYECNFLIAHSLGCVEAFSFEEHLKNLKGISLVTPPLRAGPAIKFNHERFSLEKHEELRQMLTGESDSDGKMWLLDNSLNKMCPDMNDEQYELFLISHWNEYGKFTREIYRKEMPRNIEEVVMNLRSNILTSHKNILLLLGTLDPWLEDLPETSSVQKISIESGHYPHRNKPDRCASAVNEFFGTIQ